MTQALAWRQVVLTFQDFSLESDVGEVRVVGEAEAAHQGLCEGGQNGLEERLGDAAIHLPHCADHRRLRCLTSDIDQIHIFILKYFNLLFCATSAK